MMLVQLQAFLKKSDTLLLTVTGHGKHTIYNTPGKINMDCEHGPLEDYAPLTPLGPSGYQGPC